jgi:type 1 fimbriae regulatory protein FimB
MREAIKKKGGRHAHCDSTLILLLYRHGLRVEEATNLKWEQIDFASGNIHVRRIKRGTPSTQPLGGDEMRSLRRLQREYPASPLCSSRAGRDYSRTIRSQGLLNWQGK